VIEETSRNWISLVWERLSCGWGTVFHGSETTINVSEVQCNTTLVGIDDIFKCGLSATRWSWDVECLFGFR